MWPAAHRYKLYCEFCWSLGIQPREFDWWNLFSNGIPEYAKSF